MGKRCYSPIFRTTTSCVTIRAAAKVQSFAQERTKQTGLMFDKGGHLYACEGGSDGRRMVRYNADGTTDVLADSFEGKRLNSPNDLAFDAQGRIWFTDPRYGEIFDDMELGHESVFRLDPQQDGTWEINRVTHDTTKPNGLLISPDQKWLYVAQSHYGDNKRELRGYPINDDGTVGEYEVLHNFFPHRGIDGMCLDTEGNIVATAGWRQSGPGPMIYVFAPNGRVARNTSNSERPTDKLYLRRCRPTNTLRDRGRLSLSGPDRSKRVSHLSVVRFEKQNRLRNSAKPSFHENCYLTIRAIVV